MPPTEVLRLTGMAHGGEAVGRLPGGKACFVGYAIPGELVRVEVVDERRRWARARLVEVLEPSPDRVEAPCPYFGPDACGGCQLQHIAPALQRQLKRQVVIDQLERIGGMADPPVREVVTVADFGYRTHARFAVDPQGRLGFRAAGSHEVVPIDHCLLLDEATQTLRESAGDGWAGTAEVLVRTGADGVSVVPGRADSVIHHIDGLTLQVSAGSFFQPGPAGAATLVRLVRSLAEASGRVTLDLYAGVGLFAAGLAADGAQVTAVEDNPWAAADARENLADRTVEVVEADVETFVADRATGGGTVDLVVLDPPRSGAGTHLTAALTELGAPVIVYVSCDPAALARDARVLADRGWRLDTAVPVDQFAQTAQIETVARFLPAGST
jgi:tRNA/tmRNA/rRNA uracil-C5-methylase (TrmA/RlmC/RlmD family)